MSRRLPRMVDGGSSRGFVARVIRLPGGRPRLPEILGAAVDRGDGEPDRRAGGKFQVDEVACLSAARTDRQQRQDAVLLAALKAAVGDAVHIIKGDTAHRAFKSSVLFTPARTTRFPAKTVGDQKKAASRRVIRKIAH